jgi:DNA polymerase-1
VFDLKSWDELAVQARRLTKGAVVAAAPAISIDSNIRPSRPNIKAPGTSKTCPENTGASEWLRAVREADADLLLERTANGPTLRLDPAEHPTGKELSRFEAEVLDACRNVSLPVDLISHEDAKATREILKRFGVAAVLVTDDTTAARVMAEAGVLLDDVPIGLDIETVPLPEYRSPTPPIRITKDGRISKTQPKRDGTAALDPHRSQVRTVQVYWGSSSYVFDMWHVDWSVLAPLWDHEVVAHNASFEAKFLQNRGVSLRRLLCSMMAAGLVARGEPNNRKEGTCRPSLAVAAAELLDIDLLPKAGQLTDWSLDPLPRALVEYAALDAVLAQQLLIKADEQIDDRQWACFERACSCVAAAVSIELNGIAVDHEAHAALADRWERKLAEATDRVQELTGIENPRSSPQIQQWLRSIVPPDLIYAWPQTAKGQLSTQSRHLRRVSATHPGFTALADHHKLAALVSTFGKPLLAHIIPKTGRIHARLNVAQAKSGRFSSSKPNMQNIPARGENGDAMRAVFAAPPGRLLVVADYSQLELRVMAEVAGDLAMKAAYERGEDLHSMTAAAVLGVDLANFDPAGNPEHSQARQKAKAINFGIIYGCGSKGLGEFARDSYGVDMTSAEAAQAIADFKQSYLGVAAWQERQAEAAYQDRQVRTPGGRIHRFAWEARGAVSVPLALNLPVQGGAAEVAQEALTLIHAALGDLPGSPCLVLVEVDDAPEPVEATKKSMETAMFVAFSNLFPEAPTVGLVEAKAGASWAAAK